VVVKCLGVDTTAHNNRLISMATASAGMIAMANLNDCGVVPLLVSRLYVRFYTITQVWGDFVSYGPVYQDADPAVP